MRTKTVTIGVLAGAIFGMAAHAGNDNAALTLAKKSVVSKAYADDSFQTKIPATASGLSAYFGDGGTLVVATGTDGVVAPSLILPGFRDNSSTEFSAELRRIVEVDGYWNMDTDEYSGMIDDMYRSATGGEPLLYHPKYSIPSLELVKDLTDTLNNKIDYLIPASNLPLGVVLMPTDTAGVPGYRFIIPGLDMVPDGNTDPYANPRNWALFGGDVSNNEMVAILDDISRMYNNDLSRDNNNGLGWYDTGMTLNDVLYAPASLKLVSDVWNESQRKIPASGYAAAANGAAAAVAYTNGNGNATTDWLNAAVKGTGIITKTATAGQIGERKIVEEADVANYAGTALEKISVPTMGAVMAAITANQVTLPTGTAGNVVTYDANGAVGGSVAVLSSLNNYNAANDSGKLINAAAAVEYVNAHSPTIPAPTGDCLNAANHCALVTTYANGAITYAWTVMAK